MITNPGKKFIFTSDYSSNLNKRLASAAPLAKCLNPRMLQHSNASGNDERLSDPQPCPHPAHTECDGVFARI